MIEKVRKVIMQILEDALANGEIAHIHDNYIQVNPLTDPLPKYPAACIESPSFESERGDNVANVRTYLFPITFIFRKSDVKRPTDIDVFKEKIANRFDTSLDLGGTEANYLNPIVSPSEIFPADFADLIIFTVETSVSVLVNVVQYE